MGLYRRRRCVVLTAVLVLLSAGCSVGDVRRPVPTQPPSASVEPLPPEPTFRPPLPADEVRRVEVPVSIDYRQQSIEFVDAEHGYALFTCGPARMEADPDCPAVLLTTSDGGRSWGRLRHPQLRGEQLNLRVAGDYVVLHRWQDEDMWWYVSVDGGRTWQSATVPPEAVGERFVLSSEPFRILERDGEGYRELPTQPPVRGLTTVAYRVETDRASDGQETDSVPLWAGGVFGGRPEVAVSVDGGKTWRKSDVLAETDLRLRYVRFELAPDGIVWLIGDIGESTTFPKLWRSQGPDFVPVTPTGHPPQIHDAAAIDGGMLAVGGPFGGGAVTSSGQYHDLGWPLDLRIDVLDDGTLLSVHGNDDSVWLGQGSGTQRKWIKLVLVKSRD